MNRVIIIIILMFILSGDAIPEDENFYVHDSNKTIEEFNNIISKIGYHIDSKSIKGWIRIFNSRDKLYDYEIYINEEDRIRYLIFLRIKNKETQEKYNRGIK